MPRKPLIFSPAAPNSPGMEVQYLDQQHVLRSMKAHSHEFFEFIYFETGGGQYQLENHVWDVRAGDLFLTAPYQTHDVRKLTAAQGWVILFTSTAVNLTGLESSSYLKWSDSPLFLPFAKNVGHEGSYFNISAAARPQWSQRCQSLNTELSRKPFGYEEMARSLLVQMLIDIARLTLSESNRFPVHSHPLLVEVFDFIENNYRKSISLADIAKAMNLSSPYLSTSVRNLTGRTVLEWIKERRMAEARRLLLETNDSVAQIAEETGYKETTYFIRQFRQFHHQTPNVWRQSHR